MKQINISKHRALIDQARKLANALFAAPDRDQRLAETRDQIEATIDALDKTLAAGGLQGAHCHGATSLLSYVVPNALDATELSKKDLIGTVITWVSGESVPNAYKWQRKATRATYVVKSTGLILESVSVTEIGKSGGSLKVKLTDHGLAVMIKRIEDQYK